MVGKLPESVANANLLPRDRDEGKEAERIALSNDKVLTYAAEVPQIRLHFEGDDLELRDSRERLVGTVTALRLKRDSTEARLGLDADISPFHLVGKAPPPPDQPV